MNNEQISKQHKEEYHKIIMIRSGDVEENPGPPQIPELQVLEEQNIQLAFNIPQFELYNTNYFNFEEFAITQGGIKKIKEIIFISNIF